MATVLDIPDDLVKEIQGQIDDYVLGIKPGGRKWMNQHTLYSHSSEGGMGMINLKNFIPALKTSWIRRYVIDKLDDHWADLVDSHLGIARENRDQKNSTPSSKPIFLASAASSLHTKRLKTYFPQSQKQWTTPGSYKMCFTT